MENEKINQEFLLLGFEYSPHPKMRSGSRKTRTKPIIFNKPVFNGSWCRIETYNVGNVVLLYLFVVRVQAT